MFLKFNVLILSVLVSLMPAATASSSPDSSPPPLLTQPWCALCQLVLYWWELSFLLSSLSVLLPAYGTSVNQKQFYPLTNQQLSHTRNKRTQDITTNVRIWCNQLTVWQDNHLTINTQKKMFIALFAF